MSTSRAKINITLNAKTSISQPPSESDNKNENDHRSTWLIDVYLNDHLAAADVQLQDPLSKNEQQDARWYVEQYVEESPYSVTRAREAAKSLEKYAKAILQQLPLETLLDKNLKDEPPSKRVVSIRVLEPALDQDCTSTVHQLHWELLEDPAIWGKEDMEVIVQRWTQPPDRNVGPINRVKSWSHQAVSAPSINILLVIARDTSKNIAVYKDIDPSMASGILARICQDLKSSKSPIHLNVEIVRPGTLSALKEHLERSEILRGPGYFHIVHFDLHGGVPTRRKGPKHAYLYFSSPNSDETEPERPHDVAVILKRFQVPFAVLNSCESARAQYGDNANIAKIFEGQGVMSVLAMSFKVSSSAVELFMKTFYRRLLVSRLPFSAAARSAREVLRTLSTRHARFGLQLPLLDWFIPVLYSCGEESVFITSHAGDLDEERGDKQPTTITNQHLSPALRGRDFDLLRVEKMLLSQRIIYLYGVAGVGKSALLKYARSLWTETSFLDAIVYVDFEKDEIQSVGDLTNIIIQQLLAANGTAYGAEMWTIESRSLRSYEEDSFPDIIVQLLSELRAVLIFDGLHVSHSLFGPRLVPGCLSDLAAAEIGQFLQTISTTRSPTSSSNKTYVILTGRRSDANWLSRQMGVNLEDDVNTYQLCGLQMADAINLAQSVLRRTGQDIDHWKHADLDQLELVVGLLQGIPAALLEVLPQVELWGTPWLGFHDLILGGADTPDNVDLQPIVGIEEELKHLSSTLPDYILGPLMIVGIYWHEGPFRSAFAEIMVAQEICPDEDKVNLMFKLAQDRGFIQLGSYDRVTWIHPQFTIYARKWAWSIEKANIQPSSKSMLGSLIHRISSLLSSRRIKLASQLITGTLRGGLDNLRERKENTEFTCRLFQEINTRSVVLTMVDGLKGIDYEEMSPRYGSGLRNLLFCMNICIAADEGILLDEWPIDLFFVYTANIRMTGTTAEATLFAHRYEQLLERFIKRSGGAAIDPKYQLFVLTVTNYLAATHRMEVPLPTKRYGEFVQLAMDIIDASEQKHGPMSDPLILFQKSLALRYKTLSVLEDGLPEEAVRTWKHMLEVDKSYISKLSDMDSNGQTHGTLGKEEPWSLETLAIGLSMDDKEATTVRERLGHVKRHSLMKGYYENRKGALSLIKAAAHHDVSGDNSEYPEELLDALHQQSFGLESIARISRESGFTGLEKDTRWWPEDFNLVADLSKYEDPLQRLIAIEAAGDSGNLVEAVMHHRVLILDAMKNLDFDEVMEHMSALERIYESDSLFASALEEAIKQRQIMQAIHGLHRALFSMSSASGGTAQETLSSLDSIIDTMTKNQAPPDNLRMLEISRDIWKREIERDEPGLVKSVANSEADIREKTEKLLKLIMRRKRNPKFIEDVLSEGLEIQTLYQQIYNAETLGDFDTALRLIDRIEELSHLELGRILLSADDVEQHRNNDIRKRKWNNTVGAWKQRILENDYMGARACLQDMAEQRESEANSSKEKVTSNQSNLDQTTEIFHWNAEFDAARAAMISDSSKAIRHYENLISLHDNGGFSHLEPLSLAQTLKAAKSNRLLALMNRAIDGSCWDEGIAYGDTWISLNMAGLIDDPRAHDNILDLQEHCVFQKHNNGIKSADKEMHFGDALKHLNRLDELFRNQQRSPELARKVCPKMTKDMLDGMREQLNAKQNLIDNFGEVMGKAMIMRARELVGYNPVYRI